MSRENLEVTRRNWELASQEADDEVGSHLAPDVEWHHNVGLGTPMEVLSLGYLHVEGRGSGAAATTPFGAVTEIRDGLTVRYRFWMDQSKALEAAGLRE